MDLGEATEDLTAEGRNESRRRVAWHLGGPAPWRASRADKPRMANDGAIRVEGVVREALPHAVFQVEIKKGRGVLAHLSEAMRMHSIRVLPGDRVTVELARFDLGRGRIVSRA